MSYRTFELLYSMKEKHVVLLDHCEVNQAHVVRKDGKVTVLGIEAHQIEGIGDGFALNKAGFYIGREFTGEERAPKFLDVKFKDQRRALEQQVVKYSRPRRAW